MTNETEKYVKQIEFIHKELMGNEDDNGPSRWLIILHMIVNELFEWLKNRNQ